MRLLVMILGLEQLYKTDKIRPVYCYRMNMDHIMKSINQSINQLVLYPQIKTPFNLRSL